MTLLVRDEEDIVDEHLRYHLSHGVEFVIATDHRSVDGTTEVLRRYERDGRVHLLRERGDTIVQAEQVTRMARLAATDFGADWVINSDADEFWWPRDATLHDVLEAVPKRFGAIRGGGRHFVLRPENGQPFFERMVWRRRPSSDASSPYQVGLKTAHRADPDVLVAYGNHNAFGRRLVPLREWLPIEVLHFPIRTRAQMERKFTRLGANPIDMGSSRHQREALAEIQAAGRDRLYARTLVDDEALATGVAGGSLVMDARLRDALRGTGNASTRVPSLDDDIAFATEFGTFAPSDSSPRLSRRLDSLRLRVGDGGGG